ncbi:uncharacterized protein GGS22DRAFT_33693 [Annulohypoxylon maeteangense]|uniref:uncharacterized protein n=1 Tax=Annulohypoxylon maeteangense TaxID=1927788 RepID=UPI002007FFC2|nr:uncharacterized protein GGS22DRAFT_33693 [Annulohypoxylon maeteangense]KAI0883611.1 hypothetical protein GGS22DRAFT_33693 [Annulohypoxylon maeteangense]
MEAVVDPRLVKPTISHPIDPRQTSIKHELVIIQKQAPLSPDMPRRKVPITLTYQKNGTGPPVYVAGSFSNPPWQPQEMDVSIDQHGIHIFTKNIMVDDGSEIQYKFRIGSGDWWVLDDNSDTAVDENGNTNNILRVSINSIQEAEADTKALNRVNLLKGLPTNSGRQTPNIAKTAAEVADTARIVDPGTPEPELSDAEAGRIGIRRLSHTPINEVAQTAMEVSKTAATLDADDSWHSDDETDAEDGECPVFSHEFMGQASDAKNRRESKTASDFDDSAIDVENVDFDDPQLETFPSNNRESILAAVRRISTSVDADRTVVEGIPPSPVVPLSQQPSSAENPPKDQQNLLPDDATKQAGLVQSSTRNSLGSIAEDDESHNDNADEEPEEEMSPFVQHPGPSWGAGSECAASVDSNDEGIAMSVESKRRAKKSEDCSPLDSAPVTPPSTKVLEVAESNSNEYAPAPASEDDSNAPTGADDPHAAEEASKNGPTNVVRGTPTDTHVSDSSNTTSISEGEAKSTSIDPNNETGLRKRTANEPIVSSAPAQDTDRTPNWLDICLRFALVRWIGGFAGWLYRRRNRALMAAGTAVIVVGVGLLWQNPISL